MTSPDQPIRLWIVTNPPPVSEDTAYLIGRVISHCAQVFVTPVGERDSNPPAAPGDVDGILNRSFNTVPAFLTQLDSLAEALGITLTNPGAASLLACDKRSYPGMFPDLIPETWTVESLDQVVGLFDGGRRTLVLKDPFGKHGKDVIRFRGEEDRAAAETLLATAPPGGVVAQRFCPGFLAGDKRVILHRGPGGNYEIAAWFKRVPKAGGWKSNVSAGGRIERCELESDEKDLAVAVAETAGLDYIGIDIARDEGRCLLIETNAYTGGHINFDTDRRARSGDDFARMVARLANEGRP